MWMGDRTVRILLIVACIGNPFGNIGRIGTAGYFQCTGVFGFANSWLSLSACESTAMEISDCRLFVTTVIIISDESCYFRNTGPTSPAIYSA